MTPEERHLLLTVARILLLRLPPPPNFMEDRRDAYALQMALMPFAGESPLQDAVRSVIDHPAG